MGPHWDPLWPRWLFPLHFFDSVRIGLFNQNPQPRQRLSTPIAWHLNYYVYLLGGRFVFHTHLFLLRLLQQSYFTFVSPTCRRHQRLPCRSFAAIPKAAS